MSRLWCKFSAQASVHCGLWYGSDGVPSRHGWPRHPEKKKNRGPEFEFSTTHTAAAVQLSHTARSVHPVARDQAGAPRDGVRLLPPAPPPGPHGANGADQVLHRGDRTGGTEAVARSGAAAARSAFRSIVGDGVLFERCEGHSLPSTSEVAKRRSAASAVVVTSSSSKPSYGDSKSSHPDASIEAREASVCLSHTANTRFPSDAK